MQHHMKNKAIQSVSTLQRKPHGAVFQSPGSIDLGLWGLGCEAKYSSVDIPSQAGTHSPRPSPPPRGLEAQCHGFFFAV